MIRILLVDDCKLLTTGMEQILKKHNMDVIIFNDCDEAHDFLKKSEIHIDLYLFDLHISNMNGLDLSLKALEINPHSKIIIMFSDDEIKPYFNKLVEVGIKGFIDKNYNDIMFISSIFMCLKGGVLLPDYLLHSIRLCEPELMGNLTCMDLNILGQVAAGKTNKEIAFNLDISLRNVEYRLSNIFKKLEVTSRHSAVRKCKNLKII